MEHLVRVSHTTRARRMALHALVAMDRPGPGSGFLSQPWRFPAPVYIGDTITAEAEVLGAARHETGDAPQGPRAAADGGRWCWTGRHGATPLGQKREGHWTSAVRRKGGSSGGHTLVSDALAVIRRSPLYRRNTAHVITNQCKLELYLAQMNLRSPPQVFIQVSVNIIMMCLSLI